MSLTKQCKGYKKFRNDILNWAKTRFLDTIKLIYNPDDDEFIENERRKMFGL